MWVAFVLICRCRTQIQQNTHRPTHTHTKYTYILRSPVNGMADIAGFEADG